MAVGHTEGQPKLCSLDNFLSTGVYMVQDAVFVYHSKLAIDIALSKSKGDLKVFLAARSKSYGA